MSRSTPLGKTLLELLHVDGDVTHAGQIPFAQIGQEAGGGIFHGLLELKILGGLGAVVGLEGGQELFVREADLVGAADL